MSAIESPLQSGTSPFTNSIFKALRKGGTYSFKAFYEIKNTVIRYDDRTDYVNLGYWDDDRIANPSARLVEETASRIELTPDDVLLNIGSGLGQPDVDIIYKFSPRRIIGINLSSAQVTYANDKFRTLKLGDRIVHRVMDARDLESKLTQEGVTAIVSVEALTEIPDVNRVIQNCFALLPPGGRISFCDGIKENRGERSLFKRLFRRLLFLFVTVLYNDHLRSKEYYLDSLRKSGFTNIRSESIGQKVYPPLYQYAKRRFSVLRERKFSLFMRLVTYLNLKSMDRLFSWGQLDYMIFYAEKPQR